MGSFVSEIFNEELWSEVKSFDFVDITYPVSYTHLRAHET